MLKKLMAALGRDKPSGQPEAPVPPARTAFAPYSDSTANAIYALLFCDDAALFAPKPGVPPAPWHGALFTSPPDVAALTSLAADPAQESRIRYLAYARLREIGEVVPAKVLLGVIIEVPLAGGLDVLAAYVDGSVRYVNQSGKLLFIEPIEPLRPMVARLLAASAVVVANIGPWTEARMPPPRLGNVRMSFLVSDGLYLGEGPMEAIQRDGMGGPVMGAATGLLQKAVELGTKDGAA